MITIYLDHLFEDRCMIIIYVLDLPGEILVTSIEEEWYPKLKNCGFDEIGCSVIH